MECFDRLRSERHRCRKETSNGQPIAVTIIAAVICAVAVSATASNVESTAATASGVAAALPAVAP